MSRRGVRVGIDVGGTFIDLVLERADGTLHSEKVLSEPHDLIGAICAGLERALAGAGATAGEVEELIHATTLGSNAVLERRGPVTALLTTRGFRDILQIQRSLRYRMYDVQIEKATPIVPRSRTWELTERCLADGSVLHPLEDAEVRRVAAELRAAGVETVAVSYLHAYAAPGHERRTAELLREELPDMPVTISSDVSLQGREYERTNTTAVNAYLAPVVGTYLRTLAGRLPELGIDAPLWIMQSSGGLAPAGRAADLPVRTVESGPAAGALVSAHHGRACRARGRDLARHGRHDGEGGRDPRRPARDDASVRARAAGATARQRAAARHPGNRPGRDQRRRRLDRARAVRDPAGRAAQRRRRPGARLLRARRHGADGHRREPAARLPERRLLRRRGDDARPRRGGAGRGRAGARARAAAAPDRLGHPRGGEPGDGAGDPTRLDRPRPRPARLRADRDRRRRARTRLPARADAGRAPRRRAAGRRGGLGAGAARRERDVRARPHRPPAPRPGRRRRAGGRRLRLVGAGGARDRRRVVGGGGAGDPAHRGPAVRRAGLRARGRGRRRRRRRRSPPRSTTSTSGRTAIASSCPSRR